jgi:diadenosine tetraphosphate (Ap4A) HIT family hydrolase
LAYVTGASGGDPACVFCDALTTEQHELVLTRGRFCYAILNLYPYNGGHLMVALNRHVGTLAATTPDEQTELMQLTRRAENRAHRGLHAAGHQHRRQHRPAGRRRRPRSSARASGAALERRHQFHDRDRRHAGAA